VGEFTPQLAGRVARVALFTEWHRQLDGGHLTRDGLIALRHRLAPWSGEFEPGPDLDLLRLDAAAALAAAVGCDPADLPGGLDVPDTPGAIADDPFIR
jgi:hypothetical protein